VSIPTALPETFDRENAQENDLSARSYATLSGLDGRQSQVNQQVLDLYGDTTSSLLVRLRTLGLEECDADDVVQESFLRLICHLHLGRPEQNLRGWLFQVAYRQAMNQHRFVRRFIAFSEEIETTWQQPVGRKDHAATPEELCIESDKQNQFALALANLPQQQRKCVLLRIQGMRYREIASTLGVSHQRVAMLVERGMARLTARLQSLSVTQERHPQ
jgi:RNA polymerase sigma-70 factor (ECF subfamily)